MNLFVLHRVFIKCCFAKVFGVLGVQLKKVRSKWPSPRRCSKCRLYLKEVTNLQHPEIRPLTPYPHPPAAAGSPPSPPGPSCGKKVTNSQDPEMNTFPAYPHPLPSPDSTPLPPQLAPGGSLPQCLHSFISQSKKWGEKYFVCETHIE